MKNLGYFLVAVTVIGCGSDDKKNPGDAAGVFPESAFIGRKVRVEITGDLTSWDSSASVSVGTGVTASNLELVSPSAIQVDLTIDPTAAAGKQDVTVTDGANSFTLPQAFELKAPTDTMVTGTAAQGSVAFLTIAMNDFETPFDATTDDNGNFTNTSVTGGAGTTIQISNITAFSLDAVMLIDVDAPATTAISVTSLDPTGMTQITSPVNGSFPIAARTATTVTSGTPAQGMLTDAIGTELFQFTPGTGPAMITASATTANTMANPQLVILTASGHWSDGFQIVPVTDIFGGVIREAFGAIEETPTPLYGVYFDNSGQMGYPFTVNAKSTTLTPANEVTTANDTPAQAQAFAGTKAPLLKTATLSADTDVDYLKFTVAAGDVGKKVHVITTGDSMTDALVEVFTSPNGTTLTSLGGPSDDFDFQEDWTTPAIPTGTTTIFVKISASQQGFFDPAHNTYEAGVTLE
jgi:hypothetical protein